MDSYRSTSQLEREESKDSTTSSDPKYSAIDNELERISHYEDQRLLVPDMITWGAHCLRSPTLDEPDDFIFDRPLGMISNASLPKTKPGSTWDIMIEGSTIKDVSPHDSSRMQPIMTNSINANTALVAPTLCHPHVHIDKAFLLSHPKFSDLRIKNGDFKEAMELTGKAKAQFTDDDLLERGQRLIDESIAAGVTHMRAFFEVDAVVDLKCLQAGLKLKRRAAKPFRCELQICAFAQLPLFTETPDDQDGSQIRHLMEQAAKMDEVSAVGSTPYVEDNQERMKKNIEWLVELAIQNNKHLDLHLDYNLEPELEPLVWYVVQTLKDKHWLDRTKDRTIILGHCTRLTLFADDDWKRLSREIGDLPLSFCGLPTSDLYMMRTGSKTRGTLDVPKLIKKHNLNACIGINNIGNAFTPQGSCDPVSLACNGVGIYQAGTEQDAELLYECISTRARKAIGLSPAPQPKEYIFSLALRSGCKADFLAFGSDARSHWRTRHSISEVIYLYDASQRRQVCFNGRLLE